MKRAETIRLYQLDLAVDQSQDFIRVVGLDYVS